MPATDTATGKFFEVKPRFVGKVGGSGVASTSATTIPHNFVGLTSGNAYIVTVNRTDSTGTIKNSAADTETFIGKVSSGNFIDCVRAVEGTAQAWAADTVLEILNTATGWNYLIEGIEEEHNSDGTHKAFSPSIPTAGSINDANGNELIKFPSAVTSAVNEITTSNAATGSGPEIAATGGDTNIDFNLKAKGTGAVVVKGTATGSAEVRLSEDTDNGTNYIGLKAPASVGTSKTFILPDADGSANQVLKTDGSGNLGWATSGGQTASAHVYNSGSQSISDATETTVTFDSESWDTNTIHDTGSNTSRLTIPTSGDGKWQLNAQIQFQASASGSRYIIIRKNGSTQVAANTPKADGAFATRGQIQIIVDAVATDYFEVRVYQNSGGSLNIESGAGVSFFQCHRLS